MSCWSSFFYQIEIRQFCQFYLKCVITIRSSSLANNDFKDIGRISFVILVGGDFLGIRDTIDSFLFGMYLSWIGALNIDGMSVDTLVKKLLIISSCCWRSQGHPPDLILQVCVLLASKFNVLCLSHNYSLNGGIFVFISIFGSYSIDLTKEIINLFGLFLNY